MFQNDKLTGKAIFYSQNGNKVIGEWKNNKLTKEYNIYSKY